MTKLIIHKKIYLAGPDVFFADAASQQQSLVALCALYGFIGVLPVDGQAFDGTAGTREHAQHIYVENLKRLQESDAVLANLAPFRNPTEPDSGTVFEVGFAVAKGIPTVGVLDTGHDSHEARILDSFGAGETRQGALFDATHDHMIESFSLPLNLMLGCSTPIFETAREALAHLQVHLK